MIDICFPFSFGYREREGEGELDREKILIFFVFVFAYSHQHHPNAQPTGFARLFVPVQPFNPVVNKLIFEEEFPMYHPTRTPTQLQIFPFNPPNSHCTDSLLI
jgi:hypothetical protein